MLYHKYSHVDEGFLTRLRCRLENRDSLFYLARKTGISDFILVSQNIEILHGRKNVNIISGGFEAFVGAVFLEQGLVLARQFVTEVIRLELDIQAIAENETNYKELVMELYKHNNWGRPQYKLLHESGLDHCKSFTMGIYLKGQLVGKATANSKKKAEQLASKHMYCKHKKI